MDTYVILRRSGWRSPEDLGAAAERSRQVCDEEMSDDIRWIRSYVLEEGGGSVGTVCIYQASSEGKDREPIRWLRAQMERRGLARPASRP